MSERSAKIRRRFPDCVVEIGRARADRAVQLDRNAAPLPLHELCIIGPGTEERLLVSPVEGKDVHQHDRRSVKLQLAFDGEGRIEWAHKGHDKLRRLVQCDMMVSVSMLQMIILTL